MTKKKQYLIVGLLLGGVLLGVTGFTVKAYGKTSDAGEESAAVIEAGKGEYLAYGTISAIVGNEAALETEEGESLEVQIPVGTPVLTRRGVTTTFLRLSEGDSIALLMEEETQQIKKVWIVG